MSLDFFSRKGNFTSLRTSLSAIRKFINKVSSNEFTNVSNVSQAFFKIVGFTGKRFFFLSSLLRFFFFSVPISQFHAAKNAQNTVEALVTQADLFY